MTEAERVKKLSKEYDIPDVPYLPMGKAVLVFRMPSEEKTAGGLIIPEEHQGPKPYGILVAAGLAAREVLRDALIEIGDVVHFGRFEGWEQEFKREQSKNGRYLLSMKIEGILGSVEALKRLSEHDIVEDEDGDMSYQRKVA